MIPGDRLVAFVLLALVVIAVPGPSVLFIVGRGIALGRRAALLTVLANSAGIYVLVILVAVGLGPVLARSETALLIVKAAGGLYLVWLGIAAFRHRRVLADEMVEQWDRADAEARQLGDGAASTAVAADGAAALLRSPRLLREGFAVGVLNPKALVFLTAVLPQFIVVDAAPVPVQILVLGAVFVGIGVLSDGAWGLAAGMARERLRGRPRAIVGVGAVGGALMVGLGTALTVEAVLDGAGRLKA